MMKPKHKPLSLSSTLILSGLLVAGVALGLRLFEQTLPASAAGHFVDVRYVTRTISAGALGSYGLTRSPIDVEGVTTSAPEVELISQQPSILWLSPGRSTTLSLTIKNLSRTAWKPTGPRSLTLELAQASSGALRHKWWKGNTVARLRTPVNPRGTTVLRIPVTGPATTGYVEETLVLTQGGRRVPGGTFTIGALVGPSDLPNVAATVSGNLTLTMAAGSEGTTAVTVTNTGRLPWKNRGFNRVRLLPVVTAKPNTAHAFQSPAWPTTSTVALLPVATLPSGTSADITFLLKAPTQPGTYTASFQLMANGIGPINGGEVPVTITVPPAPPPFSPNEPLVRIGLFRQTANPTATVTADGPAALVAADGAVIQNPISEVTLAKDGQDYRYTISDATGTSALPLRVEAPATTIITISSWNNRPSWDQTLNDNTVRGTVEFRTADDGSATWIINELPVEAYLYGLAETSAASPLEFRKALLTAARTYVLFHHAKKTKHANEHFDVNATTDQVYRGYGHEQRSPSVSAAADASRGMVVFHPAANSDLNPNGFALTAYFACTDGRTRSFQEVFGGDGTRTPYLVSVPDPDGICSNQRYLKGLDGNHMVGLSGKGGIAAARNGKTFTEILGYYYTGVTVNKYYE